MNCTCVCANVWVRVAVGNVKKRKLISTGDNRRVKDRRESARLKFSNERVHVILLRIGDEENRVKSNNGAMAGLGVVLLIHILYVMKIQKKKTILLEPSSVCIECIINQCRQPTEID